VTFGCASPCKSNEIAFVTVHVVDAAGRVVPRADNRIRFRAEGLDQGAVRIRAEEQP
jgi:hypothetical protein